MAKPKFPLYKDWRQLERLMAQTFPLGRGIMAGLYRAEGKLLEAISIDQSRSPPNYHPDPWGNPVNDLHQIIRAVRELRWHVNELWNRIDEMQVSEIDGALAPSGIRPLSAEDETDEAGDEEHGEG